MSKLKSKSKSKYSELPPPKGEPLRDLFKVKIEVEICVLSKNNDEAIQTAKDNCIEEIKEFGVGTITMIKQEVDIPTSWLETVPYTPYRALDENRNCKQVMASIISRKKEKNIKKRPQDFLDDDLKEIIKIHEKTVEKITENKTNKDGQDIKPEIRADPLPSKELEWQQTKSQPRLKFNIGGK